MSDTANKTKKRPDLTAYFVPDRKDAAWVAIGAAWSHSDGDGFNLKLDLLPNTPGHLVLRKPKPKAEAGEHAESETVAHDDADFT
jgi:hypothetical protein